MKILAISVVIPMYNAEKFIGECLESLLAQTFKNFEVIVVDDCSTDNSVAIVKSYAEKFGGRLTLTSTKKNSGGGGYVPRNIGLGLSRGKYVYFLDADDFIVETALEIFYTAAENSNADVVFNSECYLLSDDGNIYKMTETKSDENKELILTSDPNENLQRLLFGGGFRNPWTKFCRREFLIRNEITFPKIKSGGDFIWSIAVFCHAERCLRLPISLYFYRGYSAESITRKKRTKSEQLAYWMSSFVMWLKTLDELTKETEILQLNPAYCRQAALLHFDYCLERCQSSQEQLNPQATYEILSREFEDSTVAFLFSVIYEQLKAKR